MIRLRTLLLVGALSVTSGCSWMLPKPEVVVRTVRIPCVDQLPAKPTLAHDNFTGSTGIDTLYAAALDDRLLLLGYTSSLEALLQPCVQ